MNLPTMALRNVRRNKTRTILTILGVMIAIMAFGFLRTVVTAWYSGVEAAAKDRLVTRSVVSLVVSLPIAYERRIAEIPGVSGVAAANWFGGVYLDEKNFFAKFAVEPQQHLDLYPEYVISPAEKEAYLGDRTGCLVGRKLVERFGWKLGQTITIKGDIFYGDWRFTIRGIYTGREKATDTTQMFFHREYVQESLPHDEQGKAGFFFVGISDATRSPAIAKAIDAAFKGSRDETLTESEKAFQLGFISMVSAVLTALKIVSGFVLVIIALILGNTIAMSVRDRGSDIAIMKALGYSGRSLALLIAGESALIAALGGLLGIAISLPIINGFGRYLEENMGAFFPVFVLEQRTMATMLGLSVLVGLLAALVPALRVARLGVVAAFRRVA